MTTIARSMTIHCPDWCTQEEIDGHTPIFDKEGRLHVSHMGPEFGAFYGNGEQIDDVVTAEIIGDDMLQGVALTLEELRKHAADALAAAEWLESQATS